MQQVNPPRNLSQSTNYSMTEVCSGNNSQTNKYINNSSPERLGGNTQKTLAEHEIITVIEPKVAHDPEPNDSASLLPSTSYPSLGAESKKTSFDSESEAIVMDIAKEMKSKVSTDISLPDGWKIMPEKTSYSDCIRGLVIDNTGMPRIQYTGKTNYYNAHLSAHQLNYEHALQKRSKIQSTELTTEQQSAAYSQLEKLMGEEVFSRFAIELDGILYGSGAYQGHGSWLPKIVEPVLNWYNTEQNKSNIEQFLNGEFKGTEAAIKLEQFVEMFVIHKGLDEITNICIGKKIEAAAAMFGATPNQGDIYEEWKQIRENPQPCQHVTQRAYQERSHSQKKCIIS